MPECTSGHGRGTAHRAGGRHGFTAAARLPGQRPTGRPCLEPPGGAGRSGRGLPGGRSLRRSALPALRWPGLPTGHAHRADAAGGCPTPAALCHPAGLPVVAAGGQRSLPALPAGRHRANAAVGGMAAPRQSLFRADHDALTSALTAWRRHLGPRGAPPCRAGRLGRTLRARPSAMAGAAQRLSSRCAGLPSRRPVRRLPW